MAWEPSLLKDDNSPLGTPNEVRQAITLAFPSVEWHLAPGGEAGDHGWLLQGNFDE